MSSDSRRTSRCFSWMSLNQSTSMSSSRPSGSQMHTEARVGSSSRPQRSYRGSPERERLLPPLSPTHQALPAAREPSAPPRSLSSSRTPRCSRASSWRSMVSTSLWMSSSGMYWSAWTCPTAPQSPEGQPPRPPAHCQELRLFSGQHWPLRAQDPGSVPHPSEARCRIPV